MVVLFTKTQKVNMVYLGISCIHKGETGGKNLGNRRNMKKRVPLTTTLKCLPGGIKKNPTNLLLVHENCENTKAKYSEEHIFNFRWYPPLELGLFSSKEKADYNLAIIPKGKISLLI